VDPQVVAAVIAGALTVLGTLAAQYYGRRVTSKEAEKTLAEQREQLSKTFAEQREQLSQTLHAQGDQLDKTLAEQRTQTLNERFATASEQLGSDKPAVRLAGVYALAGLADDWAENRQTCVDVLCAYLRMPYEPDPCEAPPGPRQLAFRASREVRHTVIRVITAHLRNGAAVSWQGLTFDFNGIVFDGGDFRDVQFSGGMAVFDNAEFPAGTVRFNRARFSGGAVYFGNAKFSGGTVRFEAAEFCGGTVSFRNARLSAGKVDFSGARFSGGDVNFTGTQFTGSIVDFSNAGGGSFPPAFPWVNKPPAGVKLPLAKS
jgi:uncharacterized protein YjbI with pentapeptide repeats